MSVESHPCALNREGDGHADEHFCRVHSRRPSDTIRGCCTPACASKWRFCPLCVIDDARPIRTLRDFSCVVHGDVGQLSPAEIQRRCGPRTPWGVRVFRARTPLAVACADEPTLQWQLGQTYEQPAEVAVSSGAETVVLSIQPPCSEEEAFANPEERYLLRRRLTSAGRRLGWAMRGRFGKGARRLQKLSERFENGKVNPGSRAAFGGFTNNQYRIAVLEDALRDERMQNPSVEITLKRAAALLTQRIETLSGGNAYNLISQSLSLEDREKLGIVTKHRPR